MGGRGETRKRREKAGEGAGEGAGVCGVGIARLLGGGAELDESCLEPLLQRGEVARLGEHQLLV